MAVFERANRDYESGRITAHDAVCTVLAALDPTNVEKLDILSTELISEVSKYVDSYLETARSTAAKRPEIHQVQIAKDWLSRYRPNLSVKVPE